MDAKQSQLADAIDSLIDALVKTDKPDIPRRLDDHERQAALKVVEDIHEHIHPRRLPSDIEWFWTTWHPRSFGYSVGFPRLTSPDFALESWLDDSKWPRALIWVSYSSHCFHGVELEYPGSKPSLLFYDSYSGEGLRLIAPNLATFISAHARDIEAHPEFEVSELWHEIGDDSVTGFCNEALSADGIEMEGPYEWHSPLDLPKRWQIQQGFDESALVLRGATHTIAELESVRSDGAVEATIVGTCLGGGGNTYGMSILFSDATGEVEVWIPSTVPNLGGLGRDESCEIDILAIPGSSEDFKHSDFDFESQQATQSALAGDMAQASIHVANVGEMLRNAKHPVTAIAVRPI